MDCVFNMSFNNGIIGLAAAGGMYYKRVPFEQNEMLIRSAICQHGFREFDTAPWYGCGKSEMDLGRALTSMAAASTEPMENSLKIEVASHSLPNSIDSKIEIRRYERDGGTPIVLATKCGRVTLPKSLATTLAETKFAVADVAAQSEQVPSSIKFSSVDHCLANYKSAATAADQARLKAVVTRMQKSFANAAAAQETDAQRMVSSSVTSPVGGKTEESLELETARVTGTVYLASDETSHLCSVHDCTYKGVLLSYAQSYERLFGATHAFLEESIGVDEAGFIVIKHWTGEVRPWFLIDTLRLHDADTEELFAEAIGQTNGGIAAMSALKERGYIIRLSIGINDAAYALKYLKHYAVKLDEPIVPNDLNTKGLKDSLIHRSPFSSVLLAGCWNPINAEPEAAVLFSFMRHLGVVDGSANGNVAASDVLSSNLVPIELHNAGIFGVGLLWGSAVYRYSNADEAMVGKRDALSALLDAEVAKGGDLTLKEATASSPRAQVYVANPSRYNLAGAAITFAESEIGMPYSNGYQILEAVAPQRVRIVYGCGSAAELEETMVAFHFRPSELAVKKAVSNLLVPLNP